MVYLVTTKLHSLGISPVWIPTSSFQRGFETGPIPSSPVGIVTSLPRYPILSTGVTTAAVPVPNSSTRRPVLDAAMISPMFTGRSDTLSWLGSPSSCLPPEACLRARASTESRVTPGRIIPSRGGVTSSVTATCNVYAMLLRKSRVHLPPSSPLNTTNKFMVPTSVSQCSGP